ncbi:MAG: hypothetical protein AAF500_07215 [Myxococcota bacterium]
MPVVRWIGKALLPCVVLLSLASGCPADPALCPEATIVPGAVEIPDGENSTTITVEVDNPTPENGLSIITELTAESGTFGDPFALETTYTCAFDVAGPVEVCANAKYVDPRGDGGVPDGGIPDGGTDGGVPEGGMPEAGVGTVPEVTSSGIGSSTQAIRPPHVRLRDPLECSETRCTEVICPNLKNDCPLLSEFSVTPDELGEGETATIRVSASDPDDNPSGLTTTLSANYGTIANPTASETTYTCDEDVGGIIEICVVVSDGDSACNIQQCTTVLCPGTPLNNTCPSIASFTANPITIEPGDNSAEIRVDVDDPDNFPEALRTELSADTGVFGDRFVTDTTFFCGESGPVEMCVDASDGDPACDQRRCITVQCPSDIPPNVCPMLFVINAIPSNIAPGNTTTRVESRAQDTDALPLPLTLEMRALFGIITDDQNMNLPNNVVTQDATYECTRPGEDQVCVDATDGACVKTLCIEVRCPNDIVP